MGASEGAALLLGPAEELGAADAIAGTARGLASAAKTRPFWAVIVRMGLGQLNHAAEKAAVQGSEQVLQEELTEVAQSQIEKVAEKGIEEGKLEGEAAIRAAEKMLKSAAAALAGREIVKSTSATRVGPASQDASQSSTEQQQPASIVRVCYGSMACN
jgi:flagellar biosynthesis/type III secretory pathway protein FliH